jgi:hypothetical protein
VLRSGVLSVAYGEVVFERWSMERWFVERWRVEV